MIPRWGIDTQVCLIFIVCLNSSLKRWRMHINITLSHNFDQLFKRQTTSIFDQTLYFLNLGPNHRNLIDFLPLERRSVANCNYNVQRFFFYITTKRFLACCQSPGHDGVTQWLWGLTLSLHSYTSVFGERWITRFYSWLCCSADTGLFSPVMLGQGGHLNHETEAESRHFWPQGENFT